MKKKLCRLTEEYLASRGCPMPPETARHLRECRRCALLAEAMDTLTGGDEKASSVDYALIDKAFEKAEIIKGRRKERRDFNIFLGMAVAVSSLFAALGMGGGAVPLLVVQAVMFLLSPFLVPAALRLRMKKEEYSDD